MADFIPVYPDPEFLCVIGPGPKKARKARGANPRCPHGKRKTRCVQCGGSELCGRECKNFGKQKANCLNCGGSALCGRECKNYGRHKRLCLVCGGQELCKPPCVRAGKQKSLCPDCGGWSLCGQDCPNAGRVKARCPRCSGTARCGKECPNAGKLKVFCRVCGGSALCKPDCPNSVKFKAFCEICGGSALCKSPCSNAGKPKVFCLGCDGSRLCKCCQITQVHSKGDICRTCAPVAHKQARTREARMAATLDEWARKDLIPRYSRWNKQNPLADPAQCGKYRVDFEFQHALGVVLLEYDEQMHADRNLRCELVRQAEVVLGYGGLPVHWIRFNPDAFKVDGVTRVTKREEREKGLLKQLQKALSHADYEHPIIVTYICYNKTMQAGDEDQLVQTHKFRNVEDYNVWVESIS